MIPQTKAIRQADTATNSHAATEADTQTWQRALANVIRDPEELFDILQLDLQQLPAAITACRDFPLRAPRAFVNRIIKGDWQDPLLLQLLPLGQELDLQPGFCRDPLQEANSNPAPGLIHKYQGRVLLVVSAGCAINCRYCFRRHFAYDDNNPSRQQWQHTLDYIRQDPSIHEVIFSGGDPLAASDRLLSELVEQIAAIPHITTLRVHSRMPVVIPQRINNECLTWLTGSRLQTVMVIHSNHANELDNNVYQALQKLRTGGVTLLNQAVLLAGVNDNHVTLAALSQRLFQQGVLPYYLHLLDRVQGTAHFEVSEQRAREIVNTLLATLPGYLVPKLVRELADAPSKVPIDLFS
jgi:L-lysine 2,3-aminomutase